MCARSWQRERKEEHREATWSDALCEGGLREIGDSSAVLVFVKRVRCATEILQECVNQIGSVEIASVAEVLPNRRAPRRNGSPR
jgi:hypothetical protein